MSLSKDEHDIPGPSVIDGTDDRQSPVSDLLDLCA
jgi:hypothetical protein